MIRSVLLVGIGGALGSMLRYLVQIFVSRQIPVHFPWGTLLVNLTGCFLIGLFYSLSLKHIAFNPEWRLFLITGICGGYTTFSAFSLETMLLMKEGSVFPALVYILTSVVMGVLATVAGAAIIQ